MKMMGLLLISVTVSVIISTVSYSCSPSDLEALQSIRTRLTDSSLGIFNSWVGTNRCVNCYGVSCHPTTGRVVNINLRGESEDPIVTKSSQSEFMSGSISPQICSLDRLTTLVLADWEGVTGEIPQCLTTLSNLRVLDLIGNKILGEIPTDIGNLKMLTVLSLADNRI